MAPPHEGREREPLVRRERLRVRIVGGTTATTGGATTIDGGGGRGRGRRDDYRRDAVRPAALSRRAQPRRRSTAAAVAVAVAGALAVFVYDDDDPRSVGTTRGRGDAGKLATEEDLPLLGTGEGSCASCALCVTTEIVTRLDASTATADARRRDGRLASSP